MMTRFVGTVALVCCGVLSVSSVALARTKKTPKARVAPPIVNKAVLPITDWHATLPATGHMGRGLLQFGQPTITPDAIYVGSGKASVAAYSRQGKLRWRVATRGPVHAAVLANAGAVYAADAKGMLYALQSDTGQEVWHAALECEVMSTPLLVQDNLYVACTRGDLIALQTKSGLVRWRTSPRLVGATFAVKGASSPIWADGRVIVGYADGKMAAHSPANGGVLWETRIAPRTAMLLDVDMTPTVQGRLLFVAAATGGLSCLDAASGRQLWQNPTLGSANNLLLTANTVLVAGQGKVQAVEQRTGKTLWQTDLQTMELSAPVLVAGRVVLFSTTNTMFVLDPTDGHLLTTGSLSKGTYGTPVAADDHLFVISNSGHLWSMRMP